MESERANYDVVVVGGGISGVLAAARLCAAKPELKVLIAEKEDDLAGRLRTSNPEKLSWSCGLSQMSDHLFDYAEKSFRLSGACAAIENADDSADGDTEEGLSSFMITPKHTLGVLAGSKLSSTDLGDFCQPKGARKIGGLTAQNAWSHLDKIFDPEPKGEEAPTGSAVPFSKTWKQTRKNAAAIVLEHFAGGMGVPDIWQANPRVFSTRSRGIQGGSKIGAWGDALEAVLDREPLKSATEVRTHCRIIGAKLHAGRWELESEQGLITTANLIVAQPPWSALDWLPREYWPVPLLNLTLKTRPVSLVALTSEIVTLEEIPDLTFITSERVHVSVHGDKELTFKTSLPFEVSLDAPEVVKAIRRLRRARKKLLKTCTEMELKGEHLRLVPEAWPQSSYAMDERYIRKLDASNLATDHLAFCGDAYGKSYDGDENIRHSVSTAVDRIAEALNP